MKEQGMLDWSTLVSNDGLLPTQLTHGARAGSGYRRLLLAFYEQARDDYLRNHPARRKGQTGKALFSEVEAWVESQERGIFSLEWTCDHLGGTASYARQQLREEAGNDRAKRKARRMM